MSGPSKDNVALLFKNKTLVIQVALKIAVQIRKSKDNIFGV